jgi:CTD small phosphatase-like protein 2
MLTGIIIEAPFLPPINSKTNKYTLVLDLDETLVHYFQTEDEGKCLIRPHAEQFLKEMSKFYEIVIFTAAMQDYADWVIDQLDPEGYIKYRLYRQHALPWGSIYIKDLSRIGRELSKMIIVDNVPENFQLQQDNGIFITSWFDDVNDSALNELKPILKEIVNKNVDDVRMALRRLRDQMIEQISKGININGITYSL